MAIIDMQDGPPSARVSTTGGVLLDFSWMRNGRKVPLLRRATDDADALSSACYPLVPFGIRVRSNRLRFEGRDHSLQPNTPWYPHYLHGDGWLAERALHSKGGTDVEIGFRHRAGGTPYSDEPKQSFTFSGEGLKDLPPCGHFSVERAFPSRISPRLFLLRADVPSRQWPESSRPRRAQGAAARRKPRGRDLPAPAGHIPITRERA